MDRAAASEAGQAIDHGPRKPRVCYFGTFSRGEDYPRNSSIIRGLTENGAEVMICQSDLWETHAEKMAGVGRGIPYQAWSYFKVYLGLAARYWEMPEHDIVFVGYIGHIDMLPARALAWLKRKRIVFDAFYSLYETVVEDRKLYASGSARARLLRLADRWSCRLADLVLLDTRAHVEYFCREFGLDEGHFLAVPPGTDERIFYPRPAPEDDGILDIISYSSYIPLHGIDVQIDAAHLLRDHQDIRFTFVGQGQTCQEMRERAEKLGLANVRFIVDWLPLSELAGLIAGSDVCLGIFGRTEKASLVIPYKVYMALAMQKPVITGDTAAARELLVDGVNALLCPMGDAEGLAERIRQLRDNRELRKSIAEQGRQIFVERCMSRKMAESIMKEIEKRGLA
ncbi:MAG TPA: glycosyltransferase family 4 protein [bacterium]|nr:glycosyltransferase family 4 protein [bacterium]